MSVSDWYIQKAHQSARMASEATDERERTRYRQEEQDWLAIARDIARQEEGEGLFVARNVTKPL
jgi:hypothetical protein